MSNACVVDMQSECDLHADIIVTPPFGGSIYVASTGVYYNSSATLPDPLQAKGCDTTKKLKLIVYSGPNGTGGQLAAGNIIFKCSAPEPTCPDRTCDD